ncbi:MAG: hypothetical protein ABNH16_09255 [Thalassolituus sp.]
MGAVGFAIFSSIASAAGVISLIRDIYRHKEGPRLILSFVLAALSGLLWSEVNYLREENSELKSARIEASKLVASWPQETNPTFISRGEARAIVLSGLAFLEMHHEQFPNTYQQAQRLFLNMGVEQNRDEEWYSEIGELQQAAETMLILMKSIRLDDGR